MKTHPIQSLRGNFKFFTGLALLLALGGCGGGSSSSTSTVVAQTPVSLTTAAVSEYTTLNLNTLANYAAPVLPAYYDDTTTSLDNTPNNTAMHTRPIKPWRIIGSESRRISKLKLRLRQAQTGAKARDLGNLVWKGAPAKLVLALRR